MFDETEVDDATKVEEVQPADLLVKNLVDFTLCGLDGAPIDGLKCRINVGEKTYNHATDSDGKLPIIEHKTGDRISFSVMRDDGTYKIIGETITEAGESNYTLISPAFVVETKTEEHDGTNGAADKIIPKADPLPVSVEEKQTPSPLPASKSNSTPASTVKDSRAKVSVKPSIEPTNKIAAIPKISGNPAIKPEPTTGRDQNGNPLSVITKKTQDWWGRWRMPTLNLWSSTDFSADKKGANLSRNIPSGSAPAPNKSQLERLNLLLKIATEHTEWVINEGTAAAVASMVSGKFKKNGEGKKIKESKGWCAKYVKIALTEAAITPNTAIGLLQFESASAGGSALLKAGFRDVTSELPDARWAAPGDVVVYRWSASAWESRKTSARWGGSKKNPNPNVPNHGHIDIRSYENYISDYMPLRRHPTWAEYSDIHIYRSAYFDPLPELRMRAFLHCIRDYECQAEKDDAKRYTMLNTVLPDSKTHNFTSNQLHPWASIDKSKWPDSTAAGAYQITCTTWMGLTQGIGRGGVVDLQNQDFFLEKGVEKFSPELQDRMAVALIDRRKDDPLGDIRNGKIEDAIPKLINEWTSLPGAKENAKRRTADGKSMDMVYFRSLFEQHLNELIKKKGWK